jgi:hypothetical protein
MVAGALKLLPQLVWGRGTVRRTVEGRALARDAADQPYYAVQVGENLAGRNSECQDAMLRDPGIALRVLPWLVTALMRFAVDLNAQLRAIAVEIEIIFASRMLLAPVEARLLPAELAPKQPLRQAHLPPQLLGSPVRAARAFDHLITPRFALRAPLHHASHGPPPPASWGRS